METWKIILIIALVVIGLPVLFYMGGKFWGAGYFKAKRRYDNDPFDLKDETKSKIQK